MQILAPLVAIAGLIAVAEGVCSGPNARTKPPKGAIVVDATGAYSGSVRTVADGVAKLPNTTAEHSLSSSSLGYTCDKTSYAANKVTISHTLAQKDIPTSITRDRNDLTTTLRLRTDNIKVYNLNVANMAGRIKKNGQALAVSDTLYANKGANLYAKSYISGAVDFIYVRATSRRTAVTPIPTRPRTPSTMRVSGTAGPETVYLGRPWQPYARAVWQNSELSDAINPAGWELWEDNNTANVFFKEYNNSGDGAATDERADFSGVLSQPMAITDVLGEIYKTVPNFTLGSSEQEEEKVS
ncbi:hypothetical protein ON010_g10683 [Phytophthora cinnamomi]|nr:hypothetical protein ON010_g10683 [Phytophthora cinnamomi]